MRELKVQIILILRFLVGLLSKFTSRGNELVPMFNKMILAHFPFIFSNNYMDLLFLLFPGTSRFYRR